MSERSFVKFTFIRVHPEWRQRAAAARTRDKREFAAACRAFGQDHFLRTYSLVGTRGDADLAVRVVARSLDPIHELHVLLNQTGLMRFAEIVHSYLAMTKPSPYSDEERPLAPRESQDSRYLIVYPMWKKREWYLLPAEERMRIMRSHIEVGRRHSSIDINTAYSYGLDDQEFVVSFDADDPGEFLDLVHELRGTESSAYTLSETPIFTCISASVERALAALDGEAVAEAEEGRQPGAARGGSEEEDAPRTRADEDPPEARAEEDGDGRGEGERQGGRANVTRRQFWRGS
ncbi:MAG TPA: chlorite dismutase family protein [Thermoleophilaceae bacterium]|nr:chlorite dismutase family protein [Thermoleophilaceae bacterium]